MARYTVWSQFKGLPREEFFERDNHEEAAEVVSYAPQTLLQMPTELVDNLTGNVYKISGESTKGNVVWVYKGRNNELYPKEPDRYVQD